LVKGGSVLSGDRPTGVYRNDLSTLRGARDENEYARRYRGARESSKQGLFGEVVGRKGFLVRCRHRFALSKIESGPFLRVDSGIDFVPEIRRWRRRGEERTVGLGCFLEALDK
jgi:hypothetical protein